MVWQFSHALLLGMCLVPLPVASTPLWQLTQLVTTPACDGIAPPAPPTPVAPRIGLTAPALLEGPPAVAGAVGAPTTVTILPRVTTAAVAFFLVALPFQLLGLWQPLQSLPA